MITRDRCEPGQRRPVERPLHRDDAPRDEEQFEHVHARFGGVADRVRIGGSHHHDDPRESGATEPPAREPQARPTRRRRTAPTASGPPRCRCRTRRSRRAATRSRAAARRRARAPNAGRRAATGRCSPRGLRRATSPSGCTRRGRARPRSPSPAAIATASARARLAVRRTSSRGRVGKQGHERREYRRQPVRGGSADGGSSNIASSVRHDVRRDPLRGAEAHFTGGQVPGPCSPTTGSRSSSASR